MSPASSGTDGATTMPDRSRIIRWTAAVLVFAATAIPWIRPDRTPWDTPRPPLRHQLNQARTHARRPRRQALDQATRAAHQDGTYWATPKGPTR